MVNERKNSRGDGGMKRITTLTFEFDYVQTPTSEMSVRTAYSRIFATAKRNLIAKGLLKKTHNDIDSSENILVDTNSSEVYSETNGRGISNDQRSSGEIKNLEGDGGTNGQAERNPSSQSGNGLANQQPILN